jgi:6-phosphogluconolactonase
MDLRSFQDKASWIRAALDELARAARTAQDDSRPSLHLCLAGGTTPFPLYRAAAAIPTGLGDLEVFVWPSDERALEAGDEGRNDTMLASAFSACAWPRPPCLRSWPAIPVAAGDGVIEEACAAYAAQLEAALGPRPIFDLAILGLGVDGHTASIFPGQPILLESDRLAAPSASPLPPRRRMSLAPPAFAGARRLCFLVSGPEKRAIARRLADEDPLLPASLVGPADRAILYCER